jgi:hypothetical protein
MMIVNLRMIMTKISSSYEEIKKQKKEVNIVGNIA